MPIMIPQPQASPSYPPPFAHSHIDGETCPWCEQEIPPEKLEEISGKIALREREQSQAIAARLEQKYEAERSEAQATAKANLELERRQSATREAAAREEATKLAEAAAADQIAAAETIRQQLQTTLQNQIDQAQAAREAAEHATAAHLAQLEKERLDNATALASAKAEAEARETAIRMEAQQLAEAAMADKLAASEAARAESDAALRVQIEQTDAVRTAAEQKHTALQEQLTTLQHAKAAELAKLKEEAAAEAMLHGKICGKILYDSKNRGKFLYEHAAKLKADQLSDKADHAILSTHKFPKDTRQLHIHDGVVLANPARVVAVATLIRQHLIQTHTLRLSSAERENKTAALYEFISSDRCAQYLAAVDRHAEELLKMQVKEKLAHDAVWKKEGELLKKIQKAQADLSNEISCIIGTVDASESDFEEAPL
jgi:hypothetical protein